MKHNPWRNITPKDRIADKDKDLLEKNCTKLGKIDFGVFPEPFIGDKNAPIYILLANPGIADNEKIVSYNDRYIDSGYTEKEQEIIINNLHQKKTAGVNRYYHLDKEFLGEGEEKNLKNWYYILFKPLIDKGFSEDAIGRLFFSMEIYGYPSEKFDYRLIDILEEKGSIAYTKYLLTQAISENKIILMGRSRKNWFRICPELEKYNNCHFIAVNRSMQISNTTLSPQVYKRIIRKLKKI